MTNYPLLTAVNERCYLLHRETLHSTHAHKNCVYIHEDLISDAGAGCRQGNTTPDRYHLSLKSTSSLHKRPTLEQYNIYI